MKTITRGITGIGWTRALLFAVLLCCVSMASADERILSYDAQIAIQADGAMEVIETLRVRTEGIQIKRGIFRDFPTDYPDRSGKTYRVGFEFQNAKRDGVTERWFTERMANGMRVYLGRKDVLLAPGEYTYELSYRTDRQLGFFESHDELYWNVTGNGWMFPIDQVTAHVRLPQTELIPLKAFGYTGPAGSREAHLTAEISAAGAHYATTRPLGPGEGLTLVMEFPQGIVTPPPPATDEPLPVAPVSGPQLLLALIGLPLVWLWYLIRWWMLGRDPARGVRIPQYEPPEGYSPAALRFIERMGYDLTCFAVALLSLASKGSLRIEVDDRGTLELVPLPDADRNRLAPGEGQLYTALFKDDAPLRLVRGKTTAARMKAARSAHRRSLKSDFTRNYMAKNGSTVIVGAALSLLVQVGVVMLAADFDGVVQGLVGSVLIGVVMFFTGWVCACLWSRGQVWWTRIPLRILGVTIVVFSALVWLGGLGSDTPALLPMLVMLVLLGTNALFFRAMRALTLHAARLRDRIDGFRWYLGVAEKQELDSRYQPGARPELFAAYLPYALALGVEQAWAQRFVKALPLEPLQPAWYRSKRPLQGSLALLTRDISRSLQQSIAAASRAPGSSSGRMGSSGGGGGGGGGGGW